MSITELRVDLEQDRVTASMQFFPDDWERAMNALVTEKDVRYHAMSELKRTHFMPMSWHEHLIFNAVGRM